MENYENNIKKLKTAEFGVDYDEQFVKIRDRIKSKQRSVRIRNAAFALFLLIAVSAAVYLPQGDRNPMASKDNYSVTSLINDDSGTSNDLSEYIFAE